MARIIDLTTTASDEALAHLFGTTVAEVGKPVAAAPQRAVDITDRRDAGIVALATADNPGYHGWLAVHGHDGDGRPCYLITDPYGTVFMKRQGHAILYMPKGKVEYRPIQARWGKTINCVLRAIDVLLGRVIPDLPLTERRARPAANVDVDSRAVANGLNVSLQKYRVVNRANKASARVWYWEGRDWSTGHDVVRVCDKEYGRDLFRVFEGVEGVELKNDSNSAVDYFDKTTATIPKGHPLYAAALARVRN